MSIRVPTSTLYSRLQHGLNTSLARVQQLQSSVASGQRITKLSDDPVGATTGLALRAQETDYAAFQRTVDDATTALGITDGALQDASTLLRQAKQLAISAMNGAYGQDQLNAIAEEFVNLREQLVVLANTQHLGRAVFGGHRSRAVDPAADPAFVGDNGAVQRRLSPTVSLKINLSGEQIFGFSEDSPGEDVFSVVAALEEAARLGDKDQIMSMQKVLDARMTDVVTGLGKVGALQNQVTAARELNIKVVDALRAQRAQVEDVDLAEAVMKLSAASTGYEASLVAIARADLPSLANFLR